MHQRRRDCHIILPPSVKLVQPICCCGLCSCPLAPDGHSHCMSPSPIGTHLPQFHDVVSQFSPQFILNLHVREYARDFEDLLMGKRVELGCGMNVQSSHHLGRHLVTDAVETLEDSLYLLSTEVQHCVEGLLYTLNDLAPSKFSPRIWTW